MFNILFMYFYYSIKIHCYLMTTSQESILGPAELRFVGCVWAFFFQF